MRDRSHETSPSVCSQRALGEHGPRRRRLAELSGSHDKPDLHRHQLRGENPADSVRQRQHSRSVLDATLTQTQNKSDFAVETFLPFDLEFTYGAALHLIMANAIFPGTAGNESYEQQALDILDEMIGRGNRVAAMRKAELVRLQELCQELAVQSERRGLQALTLASLSGPEMGYGSNPSHEVEQPAVSASDPVQFAMSISEHATDSSPSDCAQTAGHAELFDNLGISSCEFLSIADQLGDHDILSYGLMDTLPN